MLEFVLKFLSEKSGIKGIYIYLFEVNGFIFLSKLKIVRHDSEIYTPSRST